MTHDELVKRAVKWLKEPSRGKSGCGVAVPEIVSTSYETPDAIGWVGGGFSYMIECKVSRADFLCDRKKGRQLFGCGYKRFYLCPPGLIKPDELPEYWGLLYCHPDEITLEVDAPINKNRNLSGEMAMMYSLLRRCESRGFLRRALAKKWRRETEPVESSPEI